MDGIILVRKEKGWTSHDVVSKVKKIFHEKVGHTGTLDPNATGLLPILVGKGTKLSYYLINHDKEYEVALKLGEKTDTADSEGKVIEKQEVEASKLEEEKVKTVLASFLGKQEQMPPMYSAIKVQGKKLYEYARKNETIEVQPRKIEIYSIGLTKINVEKQIICFTVHCSKGTYIRSLCEDIAKKLGTIGYMKELNRTKVGSFKIEDSITIDKLEQNKDNADFLAKYFIGIETFFQKQLGEDNVIKLDEKKLERFLNGVKLESKKEDGLYRIYNEKNEFIGVGCVQKQLLKRELCVK